jgi:uracil-DNA glycosylase family 4
VARDDGLRLHDCYIAPLARCAPPANKPTPEEFASCREYLQREWRLLPRVRAVLALGRLAMDGCVGLLRAEGRLPAGGRLAFGHGLAHDLDGGLRLFASFHPSQQNTFTGRLTPRDLDRVLAAVRRHLETEER